MTRSWVSPSKPSDIIPRPWLSQSAIDFMASLLRKDMTVLEFGAGGSTLWFASKAAHVTSYENDPDWMAVLKKQKPDNVTLRFESLPLKDEPPADLVFIDGEPVALRGEWLRALPQLVKPGGLVVLDNANRMEYRIERNELELKATQLKRINDTSLGTSYTVTEFYRWPM